MADVCPNCESANVRRFEATDSFDYGIGVDVVKCVATVSVCHCDDCDEEYTDGEQETKRLEAIIHAMYIELKGLRAWARSVNEALNTGDGSYRP